jgi:hypothetical protein
MPDHVHLIVPARDGGADRQRLARVLAALSRRCQLQTKWEAAPAVLIPDAKHLRRQIRYVHLNATRDRLVDDPLAWLYSTHRGIAGAEVDPWVSPARLAAALGAPEAEFPERLHAYVSGDPSVMPEGTPFPCPAAPRLVPAVPLELIRIAARAATPWSFANTTGRLCAALAFHQGWRDTRLIAAAAGISVRSAQRHARAVPSDQIAPAALCLADERLRRPFM